MLAYIKIGAYPSEAHMLHAIGKLLAISINIWLARKSLRGQTMLAGIKVGAYPSGADVSRSICRLLAIYVNFRLA